jgi:hypothetical protein
MSSPDEFWNDMPPQKLLKTKGESGCTKCQIAAQENYTRMRAMSAYRDNKQWFFLAGGIVIGAVAMHLLMHKK